LRTRDRILVTGATGSVGRHVVAELLDGGNTVRVLSRRPDVADLPAEVDVARGDLSSPDTLRAALDGVDSVFLLWPFMSTETAPAVIEMLAKQARRVVFLSAMGARDDHGESITFHGDIERLIEQSGLDWTFIRAGGFATNTLMWAEQIRTEGVVRWPYGNAARSLIHERDIATVAARALIDDGHHRATYVLTGPEAITQAEQVRTIGAVIGRQLRWEELSRDAAQEHLLAAWGDATFVEGALDHWAGLLTQPEPVTTTVQDVTGVPARTFRQWALDHADDFRDLADRSTGEVATIDTVANEYVALGRQGRFFDPAMNRLVSDMIVRVAPMETGGVPVELHGKQAIQENSERQNAGHEIHRFEVDGPFMGSDGRFVVRFAIDMTLTGTGERTTVTKLCLYTVEANQMVREEVFYYSTPPPPS